MPLKLNLSFLFLCYVSAGKGCVAWSIFTFQNAPRTANTGRADVRSRRQLHWDVINVEDKSSSHPSQAINHRKTGTGMGVSTRVAAKVAEMTLLGSPVIKHSHFCQQLFAMSTTQGWVKRQKQGLWITEEQTSSAWTSPGGVKKTMNVHKFCNLCMCWDGLFWVQQIGTTVPAEPDATDPLV